jgi:hypothetical protein
MPNHEQIPIVTKGSIMKIRAEHLNICITGSQVETTGQAQASKTSQANTTKHYSTHSSVGTRMPAWKLAPF